MAQVLRLQGAAVAVGTVLFQRVFMDVPVEDLDPQLTAMACTFIAGKVEYCFRSSRDVINAAYAVLGRKPLCIGPELNQKKQALLDREQQILRVLRFQCNVDLPHGLLYAFCSKLGGEYQRVAQLATIVLNDTLLSTVWLEYTPVELACSVLYLATTLLEVVLPKENATVWLALGSCSEVVEELSQKLARLYTQPLPPFDSGGAAELSESWREVCQQDDRMAQEARNRQQELRERNQSRHARLLQQMEARPAPWKSAQHQGLRSAQTAANYSY
eukprot:NODE_2365_length_1219_cov_36.903419_g2157_i0.p1 GENE.NODE_2365_length_1219_cov_36.903419_g2157_i0~~NODE_2365_length_1219_cov_36.903419_g2157_i0.p1  ORF type:complete len:273 (+),score=46.20 NODE_2365_length_1219_cov_36.903419_g2157_i0:319-1137(+)